MDTSRNRFSNTICVVFSIILAVLVCTSIGIRFGIDNKVSRAIIAAGYCGIVVGLAFALNKLVKKVMEKGVYIDSDKAFLISVIVDSVLFILMRLLVISDVIKVEFSASKIIESAKIASDGKVFVDFSSLDNIFATMLSMCFKLFGNTFFPIYLLQFIISLISFAFLYVSVKKIFGRFAAAVMGFFVAVLPIFFKTIASDSSDNLVILMFSIILMLTAKYKDVIEEKAISVALTFVIGLICGLFSLYSALLVYAIVFPLVVLWDCRSEYTKDRVINTFLMLVASMIGFFASLLVEAYVFSEDGVVAFVEAASKHLQFRFSYAVNYNLIKWILDDAGVFFIAIICIIYVVMYWKSDEDAAHIPALFSVLFTIQLVGVAVNNHGAAMMLLAIALLIAGGTGIYDLSYTESSVRVYKMKDDMEPPVITSIDDKPTNVQATVAKTEVEKVTEFAKAKADEEKVTELAEAKADEEKVSELVEAKADEEKADEFAEDKPEEEKVTELADDNSEEEKNNEAVEENPVGDTSVLDSLADNSKEDDRELTTDTETVNDAENESIYSDQRKYSEPEVRQTTNYGINDADFESLFNGSYVPPKFVYNDIYADDLLEKAKESSEDVSTESDDSDTEASADNILNSFDSTETALTANDIEAGDGADSDDNSLDATDSEEEVIIGEEKVDDSKDKKAYVDSFFGYLYNDNNQFEAFEPLKPLDDIPVKEEVKEEYVSHADKFADLDLDLGIDAFDNINVDAVENEQSEVNLGESSEETAEVVEAAEVVETAVVVEPETDYEVSVTEEEVLTADETFTEEYTHVEEDDVPEMDDISNEADVPEVEDIPKEADVPEAEDIPEEVDATDIEAFDEDDNLANEDDNLTNDDEFAEADEQFFFDSDDSNTEDTFAWDPIAGSNIDETFEFGSSSEVEDEILKALNDFKPVESQEEKDIETSLKEEFSYEEMLEKKIDEDFSYEEALNRKILNEEVEQEIGFSYEQALEKKLEVEESIKNAIRKDGFSYEEAFSNKIIAEEAIEDAMSDENGISVVDTLSSKIALEDMIEQNSEKTEFSYQEALETKIDVEQSIENANTEKLLEEFGSDDLFEGVKIDFSGEDFTSATEALNIQDGAVDEEQTVTEEYTQAEEQTVIEGYAKADEHTYVEETESVKDSSVAEESADYDAESSETEEVKFIENPLPLPKKHVHREMDYGRVIPSAWMHYDIELDKNNNHYDI